jgi:Uma2 family endonuclease
MPFTKVELATQKALPTMYDLPSENPEEPGLPDEYHDYQPKLLRRTFRPPRYSPDQIFSASDMNLYYDVNHVHWYKRPDWFGVVGGSRFYGSDRDLRLSYVIWQEEVVPTIVVELLSPGTEKEDLGETTSAAGESPTKWEVYEQILQVPYYVTFNRYDGQMRAFILHDGQYRETALPEFKLWIPELDLGLGLWQGEYEGRNRLWLRWYDATENWIPTDTEREAKRANRMAAYLRSIGVDPNNLP